MDSRYQGLDPNAEMSDPDSSTGFRRAQWRMLLATMFCYLFFYTGRQTFGFAIPGIERELGIQKDTLGWCGTALLWSYAVGQAINGNLADRFGGRRLMSCGAILSCGMNWVTSFGQSVVGLVIPWSFNGYCQAMGWAPGGRIVSNWWSQAERGRAFGMYVFAAGLSSVLSYVTSLLVIDVFGLDWRWIFRLPVLLMLLGGIVFYFLARDHPRDLGYVDPPDFHDEDSTGDPGGHDGAWSRYRQVLGNWRLMVAGVSIGFQNSARYGLLFWVPVHFLGEGFKADPWGRWSSVALPVGMAVGALASGWASDRLFASRRSIVIALFMGLASVASLVMYLLPGDDRLLGMLVLFGCGFFAYPQAPFWALAPDLLGRRLAATGVGILNTFAYAFAGLSEPCIGWMMEHYKISQRVVTESGVQVVQIDNTGLIFPVVSGLCLCSAVTALFIRR